MYKRRQRTRNWSQKEKQHLLDLIKVRREEILMKANNGPNVSEENRSPWNEIMHLMLNKFGDDFSGSTVKKLKTQWQNLKRIAREEILSNIRSKRSLSQQSMDVCEILGAQGLDFLDGIDTSTYQKETYPSNNPDESADVTGQRFIKLEKEELDQECQWSSSTESMSSKVLVMDESSHDVEEKQSMVQENVKAESELADRVLHKNNRKYAAHKHDDTETKLRLNILNEELSTVKAIRETVELNKIIAEEKLRHLTCKIRCDNRMNTNQGEGGSRSGSGGAIREGGGSFARMEQAHEDQYFYNKQKDQLKKMKSHMTAEIVHHEAEIKRHQEAIKRHQQNIKDFDDHQK